MEYAIAKSYVILCIHPVKNRLINAGTAFNYGLAGAIITDMMMEGYLRIEGKRVYAEKRVPATDAAAMLLDRIRMMKKPLKVKYWIQKAGGRPKVYKRELMEMLEQEGALKILDKYWLGFIPYRRYKLLVPDVRQRLIDKLLNDLMSEAELPEVESTLLALIKASALQKLLYTGEYDKKQVQKRLKSRLKDDVLASQVSNSIREVQAAISAAAVSGVVAAGSSGN